MGEVFYEGGYYALFSLDGVGMELLAEDLLEWSFDTKNAKLKELALRLFSSNGSLSSLECGELFEQIKDQYDNGYNYGESMNTTLTDFRRLLSECNRRNYTLEWHF